MEKDLNQQSDILLIFDKEKKTVEAVKGIDEKDELQTVPPTQDHNNDFLKVDKNADLFENFFKNFTSQMKDPTQFNFFKVDLGETEQVAKTIQDNIKNPTKENDDILGKLSVEVKKTDNQSQKQNETNKYLINPDKVNWDDMKNFGITKEQLEKANALEPMLRGYKSPSTFPVEANMGNAVVKTDAKLSFRPDKDGNVVLAIHGIRKQPELNRPFYGHHFSDDDKRNLKETGNMGRVVDVKNYITGESVPSYISVDRETNELVSMKASALKLPNEIKGVKLDEQQKTELGDGKAIYLENMISAKDKPFSAFVQVNAEKRSLEFIFPKEEKQAQQQHQFNEQNVRIPKSLAGVELSEKQQSDLKDDKTIYVKGMKDGKGEEYNAYVKINHEKGKLDFYQFNPDKAKEKSKDVSPADESKTQVAVNSEGKTNEATKQSNEALKSKQVEPNENQQKKQEEKKQESPKKSKGMKV
ncbi:DUF3945 domain-containing protein [Bacteroidales bacterium OttesenSCG-928-K22]|nr:DUF3945 domain-containing protein [Bacteroidales bacterium OttesenSCG-928-L14]MDL2240192.1 DUF3945 domain-containing protein [Bacteroidales bacterium OttesenSCG-928-K22]